MVESQQPSGDRPRRDPGVGHRDPGVGHEDAEARRRRERAELQDELDAWAEDLVDSGIGLARLVVGGAVRTARWSVGRSLRIAGRVVDGLARGAPVAQTGARAADDARHALLELSGLEDPAIREDRTGRRSGTSAGTNRRSTDRATPEELRRRGEQLLDRSADVAEEVETHPSYARILDNLSPDEARVLRLLAAGPQASVDVRSSSPLPGSSELVASGLTMVGQHAGCRYVERVPAYLDNLHRLGLVWFSREEVDDHTAYQLLEAQPDVVAAVESVRRARTVRRSIVLTPFGADFVAVCLA